jgi:DNA-binding NtrC family response regulator
MISESDLHLDGDVTGESSLKDFRSAKRRVVRQFERSFLESLLHTHAGNVTHAAAASGKNRRAFFELMRKHGLKSSAFRTADITGLDRPNGSL